MIQLWIIYHDYTILEYYKEYQEKIPRLQGKIFPDRPEEAAMFGCKSLSTKR